MATRAPATIEDLYHVPEHGKAELVGGEVVLMSPAGDLPNRAAGAIYVSLRTYERNVPGARAYTGNVGYCVRLPWRASFSPDASVYAGPSSGLRFLDGGPLVAVEVRGQGDYGTRAEQEIKAKCADYFAAGTEVVWDVDLLSDDVVRVYRAATPDQPVVYRRGEMAEAEPTLPGWRFAVDELFL